MEINTPPRPSSPKKASVEEAEVIDSREQKDSGDIRASLEARKSGDIRASLEARKSGDIRASLEARKSRDVRASLEARKSGDIRASLEARKSGDIRASLVAKKSGDIRPSPDARKSGDIRASLDARKSGDIRASLEARKSGDIRASLEARQSGDIRVSLDARRSGDIRASLDARRSGDIRASLDSRRSGDIRASLGIRKSGSLSGDPKSAQEKKGRKSNRAEVGRTDSLSTESMLDFDERWELQEEKGDDAADNEDKETTYQVADVNLDGNEVLFSLESLLEDLQLESRITERYKYKLIDKFSLLLHALVSSQERELEVIEHLQTKRIILTDLDNFVKAEADLSSKVVVVEEEKDEERDQGMVLDFHSKAENAAAAAEAEGDKQKSHTDSQGLSIEEMSAGVIRETLLQQKNRLDVLDAIKKIHVLKLKQKEFEKTLLTLHYSRMVKPADLQKEVKEARRVVNEFQLEISSMHQEMGQMQTEVRIQENIVSDEEKVVEKMELEALTKQNEVGSLQNRPVHVQKEADREGQKLEQLQDIHDNLCQKHMEELDNYRTFQSNIDGLNVELNSLIRDEGKLSFQKKTYIRETEHLLTQMEALLTREQIMLDKAAQTVDKIQQASKLKKKIHEEQLRISNEANKALRVSHRLERAIRMANEAYINAKLAHDKMRAAFDTARPSEEDSNWQKLSRMLEKEIQNLKLNLEKKIDESNIKESMVERIKSKLNELYDEQVNSGKELQELIRTTVRKRRERQEKSEQCIKLDGQIQRFDQDVKMRELILDDCARTEKDLHNQIELYQQKCSFLKLERSQIMNEVIANKHKLVDTKKELKAIEIEVNILGLRLLEYEKAVKDKHYLILNARIARDSIRNDALRSRDKFRYYRNQKDELLLGNKTLRRELQQQKLEVVVIGKKFKKALSASNDVAIQVRERIEEICTFGEYANAYDKILLRGASEITVRELERTKLSSLYEELRKHVLIVKMNQPDETTFFTKIEILRNTFYEVTEKRRTLEIKMNEDDNPERVREINFDLMKVRENIPILEKKLDGIEELLATRDAMGLERTLIENHVSKITNDHLSMALLLKEKYGDQVKSMADTRKNLNLLSRQIDGFICENSIASAQAETAEATFLRFRKQAVESEARLAQGLSPNSEVEAEWIRRQWRTEMLHKAFQKKTGKFLRDVKPLSGSQIQAEKFRGGQRQLEDPMASPLGWNFSAVCNNSRACSQTTIENSSQQRLCYNSIKNPKKSCLK